MLVTIELKGFLFNPLIEHPERVCEITDDFDVDTVIFIDLSWQKVDVHNFLVTAVIP